MFENDSQDEPGWSENLADPPGEADEPDEPCFGFDRPTAVYWAAVFGIAVCILLFSIRWIARNVSGKICVGDATYGLCSLANLTIHNLAFAFLVTYGVTATLWVVRAKSRDAHPWLVTISGWIGAVAGYTVATGVADPLAGALQIRAAPLIVLIIALIAAAFVALSTLLRPRRPAHRWRRLVVVALPIASVCVIGVTLRSDHEIRGIFTKSVRRHIGQAASQAAVAANGFPERQREQLAKEWLEQPTALFNDDQAAVVEEYIGEIDAVGHGSGFRRVVEHVLDQAAKQGLSSEEMSVELVSPHGAVRPNGDSEGLLQNIHIIGRRDAGYCLAEVSVGVDEEQPFRFRHDTPVPRVVTRYRPHYCVVDKTLFTFDNSDAPDGLPHKVGRLSCQPTRPPHPYANSATERDMARALRYATAVSDIDEQICPPEPPRSSIRILRSGPATFARAFADEKAGFDRETPWARAVAFSLGFAPDQPDAASFEDLAADGRGKYLYEAVLRAQRGPALPRHEALEPLFGDIVDSFSDSRLNRIVDANLWELEVWDAPTGLEKLASGIDVARFVVGKSRSGWCVYRLEAKVVPGDDAIIRAALDHELRYCMAGTTLYAFDAAGEVERSWDATGFARRAPLFDRTDTSRLPGWKNEDLETLRDRLARNALIKQFLDGLVAGDLNDVSQLDTIRLARGADLIEPSTNEAMRRMLDQSSKSAGDESDVP